jgi:hypothetical protein
MHIVVSSQLATVMINEEHRVCPSSNLTYLALAVKKQEAIVEMTRVIKVRTDSRQPIADSRQPTADRRQTTRMEDGAGMQLQYR